MHDPYDCANGLFPRDQQVKWRKDIRRALQKAGFEALDPTAETARKGALAVAADIEEADIVIANMMPKRLKVYLAGPVKGCNCDTSDSKNREMDHMIASTLKTGRGAYNCGLTNFA